MNDSSVGAKMRARLRQWVDDDIELLRRVRRWRQEHPTSLFVASAVALISLSVVAVALWFGLSWALAQTNPWELPATQTTEYAITRMVLFVLAGAVGVIGVVVAYRRQHGIEEGRFLERLAEASRLLGDQNPTVQAAGVYALAGLADAEGRDRRQRCVDVLCAYIRLPYAPAPGGQRPEALMSVKHTRTRRTSAGPIDEESTLFRPYDRHTRETIIRVITQHLRSDAKVSWSDLHFDFTDSVFDYGDFSGARFHGAVSFDSAHFVGGTLDFTGTTFAGGTVGFRNAKFLASTHDFYGATFAGGTVDFDGASFAGGNLDFTFVKIDAGDINFQMARFSGTNVEFMHAHCTAGVVDFSLAAFADGTVTLGLSISETGKLIFDSAAFTGSAVNFLGEYSTGGMVDLENAYFAGGAVDFTAAQFAGGSVHFNEPTAWITPPQVPWEDGEEPLAGVQPRKWPPEPYE